jgi:hypothetical protein
METNILEKEVTVVTKSDLSTNNVVELSNHYNNFIIEIKNLINTKKYEENGVLINKYRLINDIVETLNPVLLKQSGICNIRRFKRYLKQARKNHSLHAINKFLNLVHKRIMKLDYSPKLVSDKHEKIQKFRKEWLEYKKITDELHLKYKTEKGNFYK